MQTPVFPAPDNQPATRAFRSNRPSAAAPKATRPAGDERQDLKCSFLLVDAPGVYRKFALHTQVDQILRPGFDATYACGVAAFASPENAWEPRATEAASRVKAKMGNNSE